jgi:hypothetical protein
VYWAVAYEEGCEHPYHFQLWAQAVLLSSDPLEVVFQAVDNTLSADPRWEGNVDVLK